MLLKLGNEKRIHDIPVVRIKPGRCQNRKSYNERELRELAQSIRMNGILQPILVRRLGRDEYELISGERRLRAAAMCGDKRVPCIIMNCTDSQADQITLIEDLQRSDLNFLEAAEGMSRLMKSYNLSKTDIARRLGKTRSAVAQKLSILSLDREEKDIILRYKLTERHARALLRVEDSAVRQVILGEIITQGLNVTQSERYIDSVLRSKGREKTKNQKTRPIIKDIKILENTINKAVDIIRSTGIDAIKTQCETEDFIEYTVRIPKTKPDTEPAKSKTA